MKPYPHQYAASASARAIGSVVISAPALPHILTASPPEFDGPPGLWSPEVLLCAAVADCFILTFRGIARAAHFNWVALDCRVEGVLEHIGTTTQFTRFATAARLTIPPSGDCARARLLLSRAEHACLIANSLRGERALTIEVSSGEAASDLSGDSDRDADDDGDQRARPERLEAEAAHPS
ncbi:MAG: OsmC family protein [Gammaproteobacteria bacterium]|nr:OsmC family protein [Gammaproteobacteria bacterium]